MSTSLLYHAFGMKKYDYVSTEYEGGQIKFNVRPKPSLLVCPACGSTDLVRSGHVSREVKTLPIGRKPVILGLDVPRIKCSQCGCVRQIDLEISEPKRSYTKAFGRFVVELSRSMTMLDIAKFLQISWDGVKDIIKRRLVERFSQPDIRNLKYLAIDEISVRKGHKYVTLVMNLETGAVIFVGNGNGADALLPFWERLGKSRCRKIKAVATDLSQAYIGAVTENLPKAKLVFDHFHVVKLMNEHITSIRRNLYHEITDVLQKQALKGVRWILLKNPENLSEKHDEKQRLEEALRLNEPLATAYYMKEDLRQIWSQADQKTAATILDAWIKTAMNSGIAPLMKMGKTLQTHRYGILNWYDHPISSGPMEGTNNKIKTLKRQAYGFRDLEFFKLRILAIHEASYAFTG